MPYELGDSDWSMLKDVFANELCVTRLHPAIRANVVTAFRDACRELGLAAGRIAALVRRLVCGAQDARR